MALESNYVRAFCFRSTDARRKIMDRSAAFFKLANVPSVIESDDDDVVSSFLNNASEISRCISEAHQVPSIANAFDVVWSFSPKTSLPSVNKPFPLAQLTRSVNQLEQSLGDIGSTGDALAFYRGVIAVLYGQLGDLTAAIQEMNRHRVEQEAKWQRVFHAEIGVMGPGIKPKDNNDPWLPPILRPFVTANYRRIAENPELFIGEVSKQIHVGGEDESPPVKSINEISWNDDDPFQESGNHAIAGEFGTEDPQPNLQEEMAREAVQLLKQRQRNALEVERVAQITRQFEEMSALDAFFATKVNEQKELCGGILENVEESVNLVDNAGSQLRTAKDRKSSYRWYIMMFYCIASILLLILDFFTSRHRW